MLSNPNAFGYGSKKIKTDESIKEQTTALEKKEKLSNSSTSDITEQLTKLKKLWELELIDEAEYKAKKAELLANL